VGYVEFYEEATVPVAIALTGQKLLGIPIAVTITEAEKNRQAEAEKAAWVSSPLLVCLGN
jgi:RNA-binding protein 39